MTENVNSKRTASYLLCGHQSQPNTGAGCLYFCKISPSTCRIMLPLKRET